MNNNDPKSDVNTPKTEPAPPNDGGRKSHKLRWVVLIVLLIIIIAAFFFWERARIRAAATAKAAAAAAAQPVPVMAVAAKADDMLVYLSELGNVTAFNTVTVQSRVGGELINVAYREGQKVDKGDLLCQIDPRPYQVQLTQDQGALDRDQASLDNAQLQLQRDEEAVEAIPQQTIDSQKATMLQFQGNVKTDQGQIDSVNLDLAYCNITSPLAGRVGLRFVDQGAIIDTNTTLVVVTQLQPIAAIFHVQEDDLPMIQVKLRAGQTLTAEAYNRDLSQRLAVGNLSALDNQIDSGTGTLQLKATFPNQDETLFPNQFVNVRLLLETVHAAVVIPAVALQIGPQSSFVYVVKPDNTIEQRTIVPTPVVGDTLTMVAGHGEGEMVSIQSGLKAGEMVVTDGFDKLQQGTKVAIGQPKAAPAGTASPATTQPPTTTSPTTQLTVAKPVAATATTANAAPSAASSSTTKP